MYSGPTGRGQTILSFYFVETPVLGKFEVCWEFFARNSMLKRFDPAAHKACSQRRWSILTALAGVVDDPIVSWLKDHPNALPCQLPQRSAYCSFKIINHEALADVRLLKEDTISLVASCGADRA